MKRSRWVLPSTLAVLLAGLLVACTFVQSLDYLQNGGPLPADGGPDVDVSDAEAGALQPDVIVSGQTKPGLLVQDSTTLYWEAAGKILSVSKAGGTPKQLGLVPNATSIAVDDDPNGSVYVAVGTSVLRLPKAGGDAGTVFVGDAASALAVDTVAADDTSLFVLQVDDTGADQSFISRMAKDGGARVLLEPDASAGLGPSTLNIDPKAVLWFDATDIPGAFHELPKSAAAGTPSTTLALTKSDEVPTISDDITLDDGAIYWLAVEASTGAPIIVSRRRDKAAAAIVLYRATSTETLVSIAVDAANVYAIETTTGSIVRVSKQGGNGTKLLSGLAAPSALVVDATNLYFTVEATGATGALLKLAK